MEDMFLFDEIKKEIRDFKKGGKSGVGSRELIEFGDIKGDLHIHSDWNGGAASIIELAKRAMEMGYQYISIADHTKFLQIEHGLDEKDLEIRNKEIDRINAKFKAENLKFKILKGCEANIMADGSIDINDEALAKLDCVIAGAHSRLKMTKDLMTQRLITAMSNTNVDIISHPTGRVLQRRDECELDFGKILRVAKETGTILEINANPARLDLKRAYIMKARKAGVKMIINTDTHRIDNMNFMKYGVALARLGKAKKEDIANTRPLAEFLKMLK